MAKAGQNTRAVGTRHTDTASPANFNMALSLPRSPSREPQNRRVDIVIP